jgi:Tat protein secretion system quality control protein TatD with DNase activity
MPYYIQRRDNTNIVVTIDEYEEAKEAYQAAREYNLRDTAAVHYVGKKPCKAWLERSA